MFFDELLQNMREIINTNNDCENVINVFTLGEKLIKDDEAKFIIKPQNNSLLKGMSFTKKENDVIILVGQKYIDTYKKSSSIHHTMFIHELKHLFDYCNNKETFMKSKYKERHFFEFAARNIEIEFIKNYLVGKFQLTKLEELILESDEKDNLDYFSILFSRVSKQIFYLFRDFEIEYKNGTMTIEYIIREFITASEIYIGKYYNSSDNFTRFANYIKIKTLRNCFEDILLIDKTGKIIVFDEMLKNYGYYFGIYYDELYKIVDEYEKNRAGFITNLDECLEEKYLWNILTNLIDQISTLTLFYYNEIRNEAPNFKR